MNGNFDIAASEYDTTFTNSNIGILQREQVYRYLNQNVVNERKLNILEINCGTGADAIWLSQRDHNVLATDASDKMISKAKNKNLSKNIEFHQTRIQDLHHCYNNCSFDLIFSNFGGLNCLSPEELKDFLKQAKQLLKKNGNLVMVIMPQNCLWDNFYQLIKGQWRQIGRRNNAKALNVNVNGTPIQTWYYNPGDILKYGRKAYNLVNYIPIGFFVPPSYTESYFINKKSILNILRWLDSGVSSLSFLSRYSDHYLIHLKT